MSTAGANSHKRQLAQFQNDLNRAMPELATLMERFDFIPPWRLDDLMVSFAAPGGGVGPHRDNYDVFLCQGIGIRDRQQDQEDHEDGVTSVGLLLLDLRCPGQLGDQTTGRYVFGLVVVEVGGIEQVERAGRRRPPGGRISSLPCARHPDQQN